MRLWVTTLIRISRFCLIHDMARSSGPRVKQALCRYVPARVRTLLNRLIGRVLCPSRLHKSLGRQGGHRSIFDEGDR